jgi:hypothetical protein
VNGGAYETVSFKYFKYTTLKGMDKYTDKDSFEAQVSKMGEKRIVIIPRHLHNYFKRKVWVKVTKRRDGDNENP